MDCVDNGIQRHFVMDAGAGGYACCSVSSDCGDIGVVSGDTLNSDVYRQKLRSAFIEQQNSLSAGRNIASNVVGAAGFRSAHGGTPRSFQQRTLESGRWQPSSAARLAVSMDHGLRQPPQQGRNAAGQLELLPVAKRHVSDRSGLHRSNSSLELDRYGGYDLDDLTAVKTSSGSALMRDFGSANSLDTVDSSFPSFVKSFRRDIDRLDVNDGKAVPDRSNVGYLSGTAVAAISSSRSMDDAYIGSAASSNFAVNGNDLATGTGDDELTSSTAALQSNDATDRSPNLKAKSQKSKERKARSELSTSGAGGGTNSGGGSIFRKLRGVKSDPSATGLAGNKLSAESAEGNPRLEERQRRKAFAHYDCQSIGVNLPDLIKRRAGLNNNDCGVLRRTNTTTGASAASHHRPVVHSESDAGGSGESSHADDESAKLGDGKSNGLVESCFNFRNELGGEEERVIWIDRKSVNFTDRGSTEDLISSPLCNAVAILDSSVSPDDGVVECPVYSYNNFVFEHIDHGTFYYRRYFNNLGKISFMYLLFNITCSDT